jgi:hypothetical protein
LCGEVAERAQEKRAGKKGFKLFPFFCFQKSKQTNQKRSRSSGLYQKIFVDNKILGGD